MSTAGNKAEMDRVLAAAPWSRQVDQTEVVRQVAEEWMAAGRLALPPDGPDAISDEDELAFWAEVDQRLNALQEAWTEALHPRDPHGRFIPRGLGSVVSFKDYEGHSSAGVVTGLIGDEYKVETTDNKVAYIEATKARVIGFRALSEWQYPSLPDGVEAIQALSHAGGYHVLDERHQLAVEDYTGSFYMHINPMLRGQHETTPEDLELAQRVDEAFEMQQGPSESIRVWRGIGEPMASKLRSIQPGAVIRDNGFSSTSTSRDYAHDNATGVTLAINVPKGSKQVLPILGGSQHENESEVLLRAHNRVRVTAVQDIQGVGLVIVADLLERSVSGSQG